MLLLLVLDPGWPGGGQKVARRWPGGDHQACKEQASGCDLVCWCSPYMWWTVSGPPVEEGAVLPASVEGSLDNLPGMHLARGAAEGREQGQEDS